MAQYSSGSIKIPGLGNGTNFTEMIDQLEKIEMKHALQLDRWKSDWMTRLDAFKQVQAAMVEYSSILKEMNSIDKFMIKNVLNSNSGVCSATATGDSDDTSHTIEVKQKATNSYASLVLKVDSRLDSINETGTTQTLTFRLGPADANPPTEVSVTVPPRCTLEGLKQIINNELGNPKGDKLGMRATIIDLGGGQQMLQLYSTQTGSQTEIELLSGDDFWRDGGFVEEVIDPSTGLGTGKSPWLINKGQDAWVRIDGWPNGADADDPDNWLVLTNNTIKHIPGLTINIQGIGTTVIDVSLDTEAIKENIEKFVDATNELRILMKELGSYDPTKQTLDSDYAESQFETQKGGVLQGNYGLQLMESKMKTYIFSKPDGFDYLVKDADGTIISGDMFASLAHIGIKTDDEQGSPTYGLLVFENNIQMATDEGATEMITFEDALKMHAKGIGELFAANSVPAIDGYNFGFVSDLSATGTTKPGSYDVRYEVDADGKIFNATVNGQEANYDPDKNQITVVGEGDAKGIVLDIYNNTPTSGTPHEGAIRLKSGFLPGLIQMIDSDFLDPDSGDQDDKKGTLSVLITQYQNIIQGINDKIAKEDERIMKWRRMTELRFANLEATLKVYAGLEEQLQSQINSMNGNSGKK